MSAKHTAAPTKATLSPLPLPGDQALPHAGDVIGKIGDLLRRHRLHHVGHGGVITVAGVVLVFLQRLRKIILALVGDARNVIAAGEIMR